MQSNVGQFISARPFLVKYGKVRSHSTKGPPAFISGVEIRSPWANWDLDRCVLVDRKCIQCGS